MKWHLIFYVFYHTKARFLGQDQKRAIAGRKILKNQPNYQDPTRCVHIGDRESCIYVLFVLAKEHDTHFLVRICQDRLIDDGSCRITDAMNLVTKWIT